MEQNKTGKYLKYANGEIVLVVIGILSTWNLKLIQNETIKKGLLTYYSQRDYILVYRNILLKSVYTYVTCNWKYIRKQKTI